MSDPYNVGTATVSSGGTTVTGTNTFWVGKVRKNDMFFVPTQGLQARITADATENDELAITPWAGVALTDDPYEIIPAGDATTSAARLRDLLAQMSVVEANGRGLFYRFSDTVTDSDPGAGYIRLDNVDPALATAAYLDVLDANGASVAAVIDSWDDEATAASRGQLWVRGIADPTAFRAYKVSGSVVDGTGYRKLTLAHVGGSGSFADDDELMVAFSAQGADGTNAILGVWQGPWVTATAYDVDDLVEQGGSTYIAIEAHTSGTFATDLADDKWDLAVEKGETGDAATIAVGVVTTGAPGSSAAVTNSGTSGAAVLDFDIPRGDVGPKGINWQGDYSGATAYLEDDGVHYNGSSWRALGLTTGNAPPSLPTTSNAYWQLVARAGTDGAGTVGAVISGAGTSVDPADPTQPIVNLVPFTGDSGAGGVIGGVPAPSAGDAAASKFLKADGTWQTVEIPATVDPTLVALNTFRIADIQGQQIGFGGGFADPFDDDTGIDPALSSGYTYDAANDRFMPTVGGLARITGATASAPFGTGSNVANINDNNPATTGSNLPGSMGSQPLGNRRIFQLDLGSVKSIKRAELKQLSLSSSAPATGNGFATSSDGTTWTAYGATSGFSTTPADYAIDVDRTVRYVAWTVEATGWGSISWVLGDLNVYEAAPPANMTVVSDTLALPSDPATLRVLVEIYAAEAVTANTHFKLSGSRNNGTNWTDAVLTQYYGNFYEAVIDVSGQPSGDDLRLRFQSFSNKNVGVSGWFAQVI